MSSWGLSRFAFVVLAGFAPAVVSADTITVEDAAQSGSTFTYKVTLSPTSVVANGDGFVIYDFAGYTGGSLASNNGDPSSDFSTSDWVIETIDEGTGDLSFQTSQANLLADAAAEFDDPTLANVIVRYTGSTSIVAAPTARFGVLTLTSLFTNTDTSEFVSEDSAVSGKRIGSYAGGPLTVAAPDVVAVPVPAAVWGGFALLGGLGLTRHFRRRREASLEIA